MGEKLHQRFFANLELGHIQLDELWANVKQAEQDLWVWVACEARHKLIPVLQVGPRTQQMAYSVVHELKSRLKPGCVPVFSSDGLKHYFYALTAHFGEWLRPTEGGKPVWTILADFAYAQVIKQQRRFRLVKVEHRYDLGCWLPITAARLKAAGLSGNINTSFVERVNLTIRQCVSKLTRRTGTGPLPPGTERAFVLVVGLLSFCSASREPEGEIGEAHAAKGQTKPAPIPPNDPRLGRRTHDQALVVFGVDQLSIAIGRRAAND